MLSYSMLCYVILYVIIVCYVIAYYIILYYITLYYIVCSIINYITKGFAAVLDSPEAWGRRMVVDQTLCGADVIINITIIMLYIYLCIYIYIYIHNHMCVYIYIYIYMCVYIFKTIRQWHDVSDISSHIGMDVGCPHEHVCRCYVSVRRARYGTTQHIWANHFQKTHPNIATNKQHRRSEQASNIDSYTFEVYHHHWLRPYYYYYYYY